MKPLIKETNFLIMNKEEAQDLTKTENPHHKELLVLLRQCLPKESVAIITDGPKGAFAYDGDEFLHIVPNNIQVVESTGAGDAFASGFISALIHGKELNDALRLGMANSQSVIMHQGAKGGVISLEDAEKLVQKAKYKITNL